MRRFLARAAALFTRRRAEADLEDDIRAHLDLLAAGHRARGLSEDAARLAARRDFGSIAALKDAHRDQQRWPALDDLRRDIGYAIRTFRRTPAFTAIVVVILAFTIGSVTSVCTLLNALRWRELPVSHPEQLVSIDMTDAEGVGRSLPFATFLEFRRRQQVFSGVFGWSGGGVATVEAGNDIGLVNLWAVTGDFHQQLGVEPLVGRLLQISDAPLDGTQGSRSAVLGYRFWQRRFGGEPRDAIGREIRIEGVAHTVVGITPPGFGGMGLGEEAEVTVSLADYPAILAAEGIPIALDQVGISTAGRLAQGMTIERARAQVALFWSAMLASAVPATYSDARRDAFLHRGLRVESASTGIEEFLRTRFTRPLYVLLGIVGLLALVAAVHLANALLARAAARHREMSVRVALGAGRGRLVRELVTENVLLSAAGAAAGLPLAVWSSRLLTRMMTEQFLVVPYIDLAPDGRILGITAAVTLTLGALFGLAPVWFAMRREPAGVLRAGPSAGGMTRLGGALIVVQVALSLIVLTGAALLAASLRSAARVDDGLRGAGISVATLRPRPGGYSTEGEGEYYHQLVLQLVGSVGIDAAAISLDVPGNAAPPVDEVVPLDGGGGGPVQASRGGVSPGFFTTLHIPIVQGRDFSWNDDGSTHTVAIVSRSLADRLFPEGAVGHAIRVGTAPGRQRVEIVGVAENARVFTPYPADPLIIYLASVQMPAQGRSRLVVHSLADSKVVRDSLTAAVDRLGREYVFRTNTYEEERRLALVVERLTSGLAGYFGVLALLLAAIGLYGVLSYVVATRTREIGIRMALGASASHVRLNVVRQALVLAGAGVAIGVPIALASTHILASVLVGVDPRDPAAFAAIAAILLAVGVLAGFVPARRAARVDPMEALRCE